MPVTVISKTYSYQNVTFSRFYGSASNLCDSFTLFSDTLTIENRSRLRSSSDTTKLSIPRSRKRADDHTFAVAAPRLWNELPIQLREAVSVPVFKQVLKMHLYQCYLSVVHIYFCLALMLLIILLGAVCVP